jgi:hypothetical protein
LPLQDYSSLTGLGLNWERRHLHKKIPLYRDLDVVEGKGGRPDSAYLPGLSGKNCLWFCMAGNRT